jgi:hypothetical protein
MGALAVPESLKFSLPRRLESEALSVHILFGLAARNGPILTP